MGLWDEGPLGAMTDVMWADPAGRRTLLAPDRGVAGFVGGIYDFDEVRVVAFARVHRSAQGLALSAGPLELEMEAGPPLRLFGLRPAWLRRRRAWVRFEDALLRPLMGELVLRGARGVRSYGVSPSGVREWYRIEGYSPARRARASLDGTDLGDMGPLVPAVRFGFRVSQRARVRALLAAPLGGRALLASRTSMNVDRRSGGTTAPGTSRCAENRGRPRVWRGPASGT